MPSGCLTFFTSDSMRPSGHPCQEFFTLSVWTARSKNARTAVLAAEGAAVLLVDDSLGATETFARELRVRRDRSLSGWTGRARRRCRPVAWGRPARLAEPARGSVVAHGGHQHA